MEKLNLRIRKSYEPVNSDTTERQKCFYLITEGPTEESYFYGVRNNRVDLGIHNDIKIEVVPKAEGDESLSHPYQLVEAALRYLGRLDSEGNILPEKEWEANCQWKDYEEGLDRVCIIFDRDYRDLEKWLDEIYDLCKRHNLYIGISNPNFELWLLMHFPNISQYDRALLLKNPKNLRQEVVPGASKNKKYLEILVAKAAGGYTKGSSLRFERFQNGVPLALEQKHLFEENDEGIRTKLGSNIGVLLEMMKNKVSKGGTEGLL